MGKTKDYWISDIGDKPEHDPLNNDNYIYVFRNIKTPNYVLFLLCMSHLSIMNVCIVNDASCGPYD